MWPRVSAADLFEIWRKVVSPDAVCAARPSHSAHSAEARLSHMGPFRLDCKVTWQEFLKKGWLFGRPAPMLVLRIAMWVITTSSARPRGARPI
jgi:hypothetical protein